MDSQACFDRILRENDIVRDNIHRFEIPLEVNIQYKSKESKTLNVCVRNIETGNCFELSGKYSQILSFLLGMNVAMLGIKKGETIEL